jgi:hypothetical protein
MRRPTICLLVMVLWSWVGSVGQDAPVKGLQYPRIVARFHRYNHSHPIEPISIYTPKHLGGISDFGNTNFGYLRRQRILGAADSQIYGQARN